MKNKCKSFQGYSIAATTTTTTTTQKPIILVEKSVLPPLSAIPSPLMQLNEIPNGKTKGDSHQANHLFVYVN